MGQEILLHPLTFAACLDFLVVQYANDTLIIMQACAKQLSCLKEILNTFADSIGLRVNYHKFLLIPINVQASKMEILARTYGCQQGSLPFTYLGLPLGTSKPKITDYFPLTQRVERRLASYVTFLSLGVRLTLVNVVFSQLSTFYMCLLKIPSGILRQIDKYRRSCLRRSSDLDCRGKSLVAWDKICKPKTQGGLGVLSLPTKNQALLLKNLLTFLGLG